MKHKIGKPLLKNPAPFVAIIPQSLKRNLRLDARATGQHFGIMFSTSGRAFIERISPTAQYQYIFRTDA